MSKLLFSAYKMHSLFPLLLRLLSIIQVDPTVSVANKVITVKAVLYFKNLLFKIILNTRLFSTQNAQTQYASNTIAAHCYFQKASLWFLVLVSPLITLILVPTPAVVAVVTPPRDASADDL